MCDWRPLWGIICGEELQVSVKIYQYINILTHVSVRDGSGMFVGRD